VNVGKMKVSDNGKTVENIKYGNYPMMYGNKVLQKGTHTWTLETLNYTGSTRNISVGILTKG